MRASPLLHKTLSGLAAVLLASISMTAGAAPGDVIRKVLTPLPNGSSQGVDVLVQGDGKIVVVGTATRGQSMFALTRFNTDGSLDTAYGTGGTRYQAIAPNAAVAHDALLQEDGKVVVVGDLNPDTPATGQAAIARFNADGTLDETFAGGAALANVIDGWTSGRGLARQSTGKYVIAATARTMTSGVLAAVRFNADGTRDNSFASGGTWLDNDTAFEQMRGVVAQADDKLVLYGDRGGLTKIVRLNADGSADTTWGTGGAVTVSAFNASDAVVQPDGSIVFAGAVGPHQNMGLWRLTSSGALDTTFGSGGFASTPSDGE